MPGPFDEYYSLFSERYLQNDKNPIKAQRALSAHRKVSEWEAVYREQMKSERNIFLAFKNGSEIRTFK